MRQQSKGEWIVDFYRGDGSGPIETVRCGPDGINRVIRDAMARVPDDEPDPIYVTAKDEGAAESEREQFQRVLRALDVEQGETMAETADAAIGRIRGIG